MVLSYQFKTMIAYAIVRHHPDKKIIRAILTKVVDESGPSDPQDPCEWRDVFAEVLDKMYDRGYSVDATLTRALMDAGSCPRLLTILDIMDMLDLSRRSDDVS